MGDVSNVGCHCNSAFYFVQMPGYDAGQNVIAGPGRTIDTNQPILVSHAQVRGGDGLMSASNTWLNSNGKTADWNACGDSNYVKNMGYSLEGIVAAFSLWGGPDIDMGWLDGCTGCGGTCNLGGSSVTWTNFALESNKNSPNPKVRAAEGA